MPYIEQYGEKHVIGTAWWVLTGMFIECGLISFIESDTSLIIFSFCKGSLNASALFLFFSALAFSKLMPVCWFIGVGTYVDLIGDIAISLRDASPSTL